MAVDDQALNLGSKFKYASSSNKTTILIFALYPKSAQCVSQWAAQQTGHNGAIFWAESEVVVKRLLRGVALVYTGHIWIRVLQGIIFVFIANLGQKSPLQMRVFFPNNPLDL